MHGKAGPAMPVHAMNIWQCPPIGGQAHDKTNGFNAVQNSFVGNWQYEPAMTKHAQKRTCKVYQMTTGIFAHKSTQEILRFRPELGCLGRIICKIAQTPIIPFFQNLELFTEDLELNSGIPAMSLTVMSLKRHANNYISSMVHREKTPI